MLHVYCSLSNPSKVRQARGQVVCDLEAVHIMQGPAAGQAWDSHLEAACQLQQSAASSSSLHVALLPLGAVFTELDGRLEPCQAKGGEKSLSPASLRQHGQLVSLLQVDFNMPTHHSSRSQPSLSMLCTPCMCVVLALELICKEGCMHFAAEVAMHLPFENQTSQEQHTQLCHADVV